MNLNGIIDGKYKIVQHIETLFGLELYTVVGPKALYHMLVFKKTEDNNLQKVMSNVSYDEFDSYVPGVINCIDYNKTGDYAYVILPYSNKNKIIDYCVDFSAQVHRQSKPGQAVAGKANKPEDRHFFLSYRNKGASKKLVGKVVAVNFFVNDCESCWTEDAKNEYLKELDDALKLLEAEARRYGAELNILKVTHTVDVPFVMSRQYSYKKVNEIMKLYGKKNVVDYQEYFENIHNVDEAPVVIARNKINRSFAMFANDNTYTDEYSVMGRNRAGKFSKYVIAHEILHQFGAADYYFPEKIKAAAEMFFKDSIMNSGRTVDSLTAYLVGWTNEMDDAARQFLKSVSDYTKEKHAEALNEEWKRWE